MKKLADISAFESLGVSNAVSYVSVFNKVWLYDDNAAIPSFMLPLVINGDYDELSDPEEAEADWKAYEDWRDRILKRTGGTEVYIDDVFRATDIKGNGYSIDSYTPEEDYDGFPTTAFGDRFRHLPCTMCAIWVDVPGDEKPDWAIDVNDAKQRMEEERRDPLAWFYEDDDEE